LVAEGGDAEGDVVFEGDAQFFGAFADVFAAYAFGEGFVFEAALHGIHFQIEDALRGAHVGAGGEEAGEFVAGEEGVLERGLTGDVAVVGVGENGADDLLGIALLAKDPGAFGGVLLVRGVGFVGPAFVVEVVKEGGESPKVFISAVLAGVGADAGFDRQHVFAEAFGLGVLTKQFPGIIARRHSWLLRKRDRVAQENRIGHRDTETQSENNDGLNDAGAERITLRRRERRVAQRGIHHRRHGVHREEGNGLETTGNC
jgi:hypothetical protein